MNQSQKPSTGEAALETESGVTITVNSVKEIFTDPEPENLPPIMRSQSGLQELEAILKSQYPKFKTGSVVFFIKQRQQVKADALILAIRSYCSDKAINFNRNVRNTKRWSRTVMRSSLFGVLGLAAISVFVLAFRQAVPILVNFMTAFLTVAAWVLLWGPFELRVYDWLEDKRGEDIYRHISSMEIIIRQP